MKKKKVLDIFAISVIVIVLLAVVGFMAYSFVVDFGWLIAIIIFVGFGLFGWAVARFALRD